MQLLTTTGYKNIEDCVIGEDLIAYEVGTNNVIINQLLGKQWFSPDMFEDEYSIPEQVVIDGVPQYEQLLDDEGNPVVDEEGNPVYDYDKPVMTESVLLRTKEQIFEDTYGSLDFYKINDTWTLFKNQSIWDNLNVNHVQDLVVGDIVYDGSDNDVTIDSIEEGVGSGWWRLTVSGDHSYIADNLTLHNASRYWVGGGSSANWSATANTNWGSTSGGTNNASVPTSVDDVTFDGSGTNGNTNSTISATITILSLNITTGYTSTMTHNAVLTIAGNWTFTSGYTIAGTSGITISATSTITSNGKTWPNDLTFLGALATKTLVGNLTINGILYNSSSTTFNKTTSEICTIVGGISVTSVLQGSVDIYLTGGTWTGTSSIGVSIRNNLFLNGNITIGTYINFADKNLVYQSGTVTTTGSTFIISGNCTLNTNGIDWKNVNTVYGPIITLTSNFSISDLLTISGTTTINKTTSETITVGGGMTLSNTLSGTADIYLTGGTWSGTSTISNNLYLNGSSIISGTVNFSGNNLTYQSGNIITAGSTLTLSTNNQTISSGNIIWNNITCNGGTTKTLIGNLILLGELFTNGSTAFNKNTNEIIIVNGLRLTNDCTGTADIYFIGGTWTGPSAVWNNLFINGDIIINGSIRYRAGKLTYQSGKINSTNGTLNITASASFVGMNKMPLQRIVVTAGQTLTMDRFFTGTPSQICQVSSTGANYTITFTDGFEKMGRYVAVSGATFSRPNQLLIITNPRFNTNRSTNIGGVRYINQSPNGVPRNAPSITDTMTVPALGLVSDPNFIKQG